MKYCMIIRGAQTKPDGTERVFRPATPTPDKHWAYMLKDAFSHILNVQVVWADNEPTVGVTPKLHEESDTAFRKVMKFAEDNNLEVSTDVNECEFCEGHEACIGRKVFDL